MQTAVSCTLGHQQFLVCKTEAPATQPKTFRAHLHSATEPLARSCSWDSLAAADMKIHAGLGWWCTPVIPALGKLMEEDEDDQI